MSVIFEQTPRRPFAGKKDKLKVKDRVIGKDKSGSAGAGPSNSAAKNTTCFQDLEDVLTQSNQIDELIMKRYTENIALLTAQIEESRQRDETYTTIIENLEGELSTCNEQERENSLEIGRLQALGTDFPKIREQLAAATALRDTYAEQNTQLQEALDAANNDKLINNAQCQSLYNKKSNELKKKRKIYEGLQSENSEQ